MSGATSDRHREEMKILHVVQGQIGVTDDASVIYTAIVGVGLVICMSDPQENLGGMAHCMFAQSGNDARFGDVAIRSLIDQISDKGGQISRLEARIYGGSKLHEGRRDIGKDNAAGAQQILRDLNIKIVDQNIGRNVVRRIRFCPTTGKTTLCENGETWPYSGS
ncbi:chemotaxis protein CheD [Pseudorhodobacter aquimaris]|uniref:chemotaxis protein CheD n=1 Tax=Pseudorhodobacter aquimaris TaxID=687412 RepID=UPI00067B022E|nr:chemotaxis protein CheD [Pseudorhodobacter aquimaris]